MLRVMSNSKSSWLRKLYNLKMSIDAKFPNKLQNLAFAVRAVQYDAISISSFIRYKLYDMKISTI